MPQLGEITYEGTLFDKHAFSVFTQDIHEVPVTLLPLYDIDKVEIV